MSTKFHVTDDGPKSCSASIRDCPIGGAHFESQEAAQQSFENKMNSGKGLFSKFTKDKNPATRHIRNADKRIRAMEKDLKARDARQFKDTAYQQILREVSEEEFKKMEELETSTRQASIGYLKTEDGEDRVVGVSYGGDYKAEEEWGLSHIRKALANGDFEKDDVAYLEKNGKGVLVIRGEDFGFSPESEYAQRSVATAMKRFDDYVPYDEQKVLWQTERKYGDKKVAELRSMFKGKINPLPTKRDDLMKAITVYETNPPTDTVKVPQGEFQNGKVLSIVSDNKAMMATMRKAKEAHDAGTLRMGNSRNPFARGVVFYDDRDVSRDSKVRQVKIEEGTKLASENIKESWDKLKRNGSAFAVSPHVDEDLQDINDAKYWVNYYPNKVPEGTKLEGGRSVFGYFKKTDIDAMANGDFSEVTRRVTEAEAKNSANKK